MRTTTRVNFHCHSTLSDGYLSPEAVAEQLAAAEVRYAALTDHDTLAGIPRFKEALARLGIGHIVGLEIFAAFDGKEVHLLAYGFDPEHPAIRALLPGEPAPLANGPAALVDSLKESWSRMRRREAAGGAARPEADGLPTAAAAIAAVHEAGGRTFLAHPLALQADPALLEAAVVELKAQGLDGIEALYGPYPAASRNLLLQMAEKHALLVVAGTDFHGPTTPGLSLTAIEMPTERWKAFRKAVAAPRRAQPAQPPDGLTRSAPPVRPASHWGKFFAHIVLPTALAICLFITAVFAFIVPALRETLLDRKRELIRELTQSARSVLVELEKEAAAGQTSRAEAQRLAVSRIQTLRYGKEGKDYFWITDMHPRMLMHPYRPDLNGKDLTDYVDPLGNRVFVEFVRVVRQRQAGYVDYVWQWQDQPGRLEAKESYVTGFAPWGWIVGTGMYLEDVQAEIDRLLQRLIWLFVGIIVVLAMLLLYAVRQSMKIEQERGLGEAALRESHEKYRALVEVSTEGTMMVVDGRCTYFNPTMLRMLGYDADEFLLLDLEELLPQTAAEGDAPSPLAGLLRGELSPEPFETRMRTKGGRLLEVMAAATPISVSDKRGFILVAKDITRHERIEGELLGGAHAYAPLAEQANVGVFRVGPGRRRSVVRANPAARRIFGLEAEAGPAAADFLELLLEPRDRADIVHDMETRAAVTDRLLRLRVQGEAGPFVALTLVAVRDETGAVKHWDGLVLDVTRQRRLELQRETLITELQTSLLFLNDSIKLAQYHPPQCGLATSIGAAAGLMTRQGSSALFVAADSGEVVGLLTDADLRERAVAKRLDLARPAFEIMSAPLVAIPDTALVYEAILAMQEQGKRHLAVRDGAGRITGLVTDIALFHFDRYSSIVMTREIAQAESVAALADLYGRLPRLVGALVDSGAKPRNVTRVITRTQDAIVVRLIELAMARLGPAPAPFAFVALGSEGREEKTLVGDQDNAIVYADPTPEAAEPTAAYFQALGTQVCDGLAAIGCPYCRGGIMAKTPDWCRPLDRWKERFTRWITTAKPQDFLEINMFFDFRAVYGDAQLLADLRQHIDRQLKLTVPFFVNYAQNALLYKPPIGFFGSIVADAMGSQPRTFNLKDALRPIVGFARLYALQHRLTATNTLDRLQQLLEREVVRRAVCEEAVAAYNWLMGLRLEGQAAAQRMGAAPSNDIEPKTLTAIQASTLKQALLQVTTIQKQIQQDFVGTAPSL